MLWVLVRSASPQHMFLLRNKKNIDTLGLKIASCQELWSLAVSGKIQQKNRVVLFFVFYARRQFTMDVKPNFLEKMRKIFQNVVF